MPGIAEEVSISQEGGRVRLRWTAPSRNNDGTVERIDLESAIVLRRVIDLEALVAEQTRTPESEETQPTPAPVGETLDRSRLQSPPEPGEAVPAATTPTPSLPEPAEGEARATPAIEDPGEVVSAPMFAAPSPSPQLVIPPFAAEATQVATAESTQPGGAGVYEEEIDPAWYGKRLEYAIIYQNRKGRRSPASAVAEIDPVPPLDPPSTIDVSSGDGFVNVRWNGGVSAGKSNGFAIFRRGEADATYPERPVNDVALRETEFFDRTALFGTPLCYIVRTVLLPDDVPAETTGAGGLVSHEGAAVSSSDAHVDSAPDPEPTAIPGSVPDTEASGASATGERDQFSPVVPRLRNPVSIWSVASPEGCLTPEDRFAPPSPTDVVPVVAAEGILLTWRIVDAPDLAGYKIYRASSRDGPFELVGESVMGSFTDTEAEPGRTFYYAVTAVDDAPAANESPPSQLAEVSRPSGP